MAEIAMEAVLNISEIEWNDVSFDVICMKGKPDRIIYDMELKNGIVMDKEISHP